MYSYAERIRADRLSIELGNESLRPFVNWVTDKEFSEELASGIRAVPRRAHGLRAFVEVFSGAEDTGCRALSGARPLRVSNDQGTGLFRAGIASCLGSGVAYSPDNATCEGFFGRLKTELFYAQNWQSTTIEQFAALDSYIRGHNKKRIKISLGARSPIEYRRSLRLDA